VQQCAWSGGSTVQSICARGYVSVSCTTAMIDTNGGNTTFFIQLAKVLTVTTKFWNHENIIVNAERDYVLCKLC
jgi:hypothetical protein